jgi:uncharacterized membrane protein YhaH (DUF805 family)
VGDLMYFTLTICLVTLSHLIVDHQRIHDAARSTFLSAFLFLAFIAVLFLGLSPSFKVEPAQSGLYTTQDQLYATQDHRLITSSLILALFTLVFGLAVEAWLCRRKPRHPTCNSTRDNAPPSRATDAGVSHP